MAHEAVLRLAALSIVVWRLLCCRAGAPRCRAGAQRARTHPAGSPSKPCPPDHQALTGARRRCGRAQVQALLRLYAALLPHLRDAALRCAPAGAAAAAAAADPGDAGAPAAEPDTLEPAGSGAHSRCGGMSVFICISVCANAGGGRAVTDTTRFTQCGCRRPAHFSQAHMRAGARYQGLWATGGERQDAFGEAARQEPQT